MFVFKLKIAFVLSFALAALSAPALAAGTHATGHEETNEHAEMVGVGMPGDMKDLRKTVKITMKEMPDGTMVFDPAKISFSEGQTVRLLIKNAGAIEHEFVLDSHAQVMEHKTMMDKFPDMQHDDPNAVRVQPGETGQLVWNFVNSGQFEFACLIPGHYDLGMHGDVTITP